MKNYWLKLKEKKNEAKETEKRRVELLRREAIKKSLYGSSKKKPCNCKDDDKNNTKINAKFLEEAKQLEVRWAKTGLLEGIAGNWHRQVTAVLLEGQRLLNEQPYGLKVRTKTRQHKHGFSTLEDLYRHIDLYADDMKYYVTFSATGNCEPADEQEMVLTIYENKDRYEGKILCPISAGGDWAGYDDHRKKLPK